jgi:hypothetical protein
MRTQMMNADRSTSNRLHKSERLVLQAQWFASNAKLSGSEYSIMKQLKVSDNQRFLVHEDGTPFFYLADTAWELFHRCDREEVDLYLRNRAAKGFTVIQAVVLAEENGLHDPNSLGEIPLHNDDPTQPNDKYFEHVDYIVQRAAELGLVIGMLPTWGDKWNKKWGAGPEIFTPENARIYGEWLGRRYRDNANIIWILGGDRPWITKRIVPLSTRWPKVWDRATAEFTSKHFIPWAAAHHQPTFHDASWLDFNMWQSGHGRHRDNYNSIAQDTSALRSNRCWTANLATKITKPVFNCRTAFSIITTYASHSTGRCSLARAATPTAATMCGRCGSRDVTASTIHACRGLKPSTYPAPDKCCTRARCSKAAPSCRAFPTISD